MIDTDETVETRTEDVDLPESDESTENNTEPSISIVGPDGQPVRINFADNDELVEKAREIIEKQYDHNKTNRSAYEDIWRLADSMYKCGQNSSISESERQRHDRQSDGTTAQANMTMTKAQKKGSTLFFRQVRTLASQIVSVVNSKPDPYRYAPIIGCDLFASDEEAYKIADQENLLNRWARKKDKFDVKVIRLMFLLAKYGNQPVYVGWNYNKAKRNVRTPIRGQAQSPGQEAPIIGWTFDNSMKVIDAQPTLEIIPLEDFWADAAIGDIQKQSCIVVDEYVPLSVVQQNEYANGFYYGTDRITSADKWNGMRDDSQVGVDRSESSGLDNDVDLTDTELYKKSDVFVCLPITDEGKWNEKAPMQKWWLTFVGNDLGDAKCVRFERNPDPDDEWPFEMLHALPDDSGRLYHFGYAEALRGNYDEQSTTRQQLVDNRTLQMNKPLKAIRGEVFQDNLTIGKDKIFWVEKENSITDFQIADIQQNGLLHLNYFDEDANRAAGTDKSLMGEYAGARTSASEASIVAQNSTNPHIMLAKYVLHTFLEFHARKSLSLWHQYGDSDLIVSITEKGVRHRINPAEMFGEFEVEINLVDEYEQNALNIQTMTQAIQTLVPMFASVMDLPKVGADVFGKVIKGVDVTRWFKPNGNKDAIQLAERETRAMVDSGTILNPAQGEDHDSHLGVHESERVRWKGAEDQNPNIQILDRHIMMTKYLKDVEGQMMAQASQMPNMMTGNQTPGEAVGNQIAGQIGALQ